MRALAMSGHDIESILCPHCSAQVEVGDRVCRRCGARLDAAAAVRSQKEAGPVLPRPGPERPKPRHDVAQSRWAVLVLLFAALGPLAFPVLWRSPRFSRAWKVILTIVVSILTVVVVWLLWYVIHLFVAALKEYRVIDAR
jgi:hypothetical protein